MGTINSISTLLNQFGIEIPLIQRDYVQGRIHEVTDKTSDELKDRFKEEKDKRNGFVKQLLDALRTGEPKKLTFIYGVLRDNDKPNCHQESFIPIDGQQRLTTLFLLCWMLGHNISIQQKTRLESIIPQEFLKGFRSFRYKTRPSSNLFCERLVAEDFIPANKVSISENIKSQPWFGDGWLKDPSVQAMLQMLDEIENQLNQSPDCWNTMFDNLFKKDVITFEFLNMDTYRLSDDLYVKMNARGKQLTPFELFKASFTKSLKDKYPDVKYNNKTLQEYFNDAVEHKWTNLFWRYCLKDINAYNEYKKALDADINVSGMNKGKEYAVIDDYFMNFFNAMSQVIYHVTHSEEKRVDDIQAREALLESSDNIQLVFHFLDKLCDIKDKNDSLWGLLFYVTRVDFNKADHKVRLFESENRGVNLLDRCVVKGARNMDILLLYALLRYPQTFYSDDFAFYMRHIRNWLIKKACHTRNDSVQITEDLELSKLEDFDDEINSVSTFNAQIKTSFDREIVEDLEYVKGNLIPQILRIHNYDASLKNAFEAFDSLTDDDKRKVLIANGFTGIRTKDCSHGHCCFFGNSDSNRFSFLFMLEQNDHDDTLSGPFNSFIDRLSKKESAHDQITNTLNSKIANKEFDFIYYALKYESFLKVRVYRDSKYYLSINGDIKNLDIVGLGNYSQSPLRSNHAEPFTYTISRLLSQQSTSTDGGKKYFLAYSAVGNNPTDLWIFDSYNAQKPILTVHHEPSTHTMVFIDANGELPLPSNSNQDLIEQSVNEVQKRLSPCTFEER